MATEYKANMLTLHAAPPSFEDPIEMLIACHGKVRHFATLAPKLAQHTQTHGADSAAQNAAQSILRYFEMAAPLHHADEDIDLYPALRALGDATLNSHIERISAEHDKLGVLWQVLKPWLQAVSQGQSRPVPGVVALFAKAYPAHAQAEEELIYPAATRLSEITIQAISQSMQKRRQSH